jgi:nicotinate-nucleotide adenylyltransferase
VKQPIGILGGTFDPAHNAHLAIASAAMRALGLQKILWLPTGAPAYRPAPIAAAAHRVAMLKLAIANEPRYAVDERELEPGASGFTYDSIEALREQNPEAEFILLLGADQYEKRASWHRWTARELAASRLASAARANWAWQSRRIPRRSGHHHLIPASCRRRPAR